jgi:hypothetical protein
MIRIFPKIDEDDLFMRLFHKGVASQWSSEEVDWEAPVGLTPRQAKALTRILTPVYLGEQTAMLGASAVLPQLANAGETAAQLYLSTFLLDEARHFEALTRLYKHLGHDPVGLREIPEMLRYHHRLRQGDRVDWLWGILISDLFAREFYLSFSKVQPEALFGRMSGRILIDESRHQAFAHTYLRRVLPHLSQERRQGLLAMKEELLQTMRDMNRRLADDTAVLAFDGEAFFGDLEAQITAHSRGIGLGSGGSGEGGDSDAGGDGHGSGERGGPSWWGIIAGLRRQSDGGVSWPVQEAELRAPVQAVGAGPRRSRRHFIFGTAGQALDRCTDCFMALLCRSRLVRAASGC